MNKKFRQFKWFAATLMLVAAMVMPSVAWADGSITPSKPKTGDGSAASPYQIGTAAELYWFAGLVNGDTNVCNFNADTNPEGTQQNKAACAVLTANIVVNSGLVDCNTMLGSLEYDTSGNVTNGSNFVAWTPIGFNYQNYIGTFDGKGYTVSGLYFNDTSKEKVGLFGRVDSGGKISNVGVLDSYFQFRMQGGGICGLNYYGEINNCTNDGTVIGNSTGSGAGGVCGMNYGTVKNCTNTGSVSGTVSYIGGVCGAIYSGTIENCLNGGTVSGTGNTTSNGSYGGVCGQAYGGVIKLSSNTASIRGYNAVGGVCGSNMGATLEDCYNTGAVIGTALSSFGGVCGSNTSSSTIKNCYNTGAVSGKNNVGGVCGDNSSIITNCYYISGTATGGINGEDATGSAESKTETQFKSGEVALLLNGGKTEGSQAWYQNLSAQSGDAYPVLKSTEGNTVYGGYKHGGNTGKFSNTASVISEGYIHLHAYDSSAADEANGNHDKSYQGEFTWADNNDKTNASVTATFTCSVCGKVVEPEMTVVHDDEHTNKPAACTEVGYNYFKTSHAFTGAIFTDSYTQTVPALGHNMNGITFNEDKKIYSNQCQRENCGYIGYYATSDGSVEAKLEDGIYKVKSFTLQDATTYDNRAVFSVNDFTYARTFEDTGWTTWYVPFDLVLTEELCNTYSFSRINNVHRYDDNDDGTPDRTEVEAFNQLVGVTLKANYPYLVKAKTDGNLHMDLLLNSVTPAKAEDNGCFCQSVDYKYSFTGTYSGLSEVGTGSEDPYSLQSNGEWTHQSEISPMRHYLTVTSRNAAPLSSLARISLVVIGDETLTGTVIPYSQEKRQTETYDLSGRLTHSNQRGIVIRNGKKIIQK